MSDNKKYSHTPGPWTALKYPDVKSWTVAGKERSVASKVAHVYDANLISVSPDALAILATIKRFIDEGASSVSLGALMDSDDEITIAQAIEAYFKKLGGE